MRIGAVVTVAIVATGAVGLFDASARSASLRTPSPVTTRRSTSANASGTPLDPTYFAPGSCLAYPPTSGDRHTTVFLDAGHGGIDPGAVGTDLAGRTIEESQLTLPVELDAMALLRAHGFRVVVSRTTDSTVLRLAPVDRSGPYLSAQGVHDEVVARDVCANDAGAGALVGIYYDSGASPSNAGSIAAYDTARPFAAANQRLATYVQSDVLAAMNAQGWGIPDDGVSPDSGLGSLSGDPSQGGVSALAAHYGHLLLLGPPSAGFLATPSTMPGTIVEPLYVTDPFEGSIAEGAAGQAAIAGGIAAAVEQFLAPVPSAAPAHPSLRPLLPGPGAGH